MKIKDKIIAEIKKVYDPEIPVNIYDLGLIYNIEVKNENEAYIEMTLTSPNCPVADSLPKMVKENINSIEEIKKVDTHIGEITVFDVYNNENKSELSLAIEVEIIQQYKVLNTQEIGLLMDNIIKTVEKNVGAKLRTR